MGNKSPTPEQRAEQLQAVIEYLDELEGGLKYAGEPQLPEMVLGDLFKNSELFESLIRIQYQTWDQCWICSSKTNGRNTSVPFFEQRDSSTSDWWRCFEGSFDESNPELRGCMANCLDQVRRTMD